jgi:hypothetical protein
MLSDRLALERDQAGDLVKATVAPLLSGQPGGLGLDVTLPTVASWRRQSRANTFKRTPEKE